MPALWAVDGASGTIAGRDGYLVQFRIADTFTDSLAKLTGDERKAVKTAAFDLQMNPAVCLIARRLPWRAPIRSRIRTRSAASRVVVDPFSLAS